MRPKLPTHVGTARLDRRRVLARSAAGLAVPTALGLAGATAVRASGDTATGPGAALPRGQAAGGGLSPAGLDRLHQVMAGHVEAGVAPGLVAVVSRRGEPHFETIGTLGFENEAPMQPDTIFRLASVTKLVTAVAAMILIEECVLRLDDPVDPLLPELADRRVLRSLESEVDDTVPASRPITVRDLLTFRLGYGLLFDPPGTYPIQAAMAESGVFPNIYEGGTMPTLPPDELMAGYGELPLLHQPGEQWVYNSGADIMGVLIGRASGMTLGEFMRERIFDPLGMPDTGFHVPAAKRDRFADSYFSNPETGEPVVFDAAADSRWASPPPFEAGAGSLVSTADDLLRFGQMLLNGGTLGEERILSRPSIELMTMDHITPEQKAASAPIPVNWENTSWGLGLSVVTRRDTLANVGQYGWWGGYGTSLEIDPTAEMVMILLTQRAADSPAIIGAIADFETLSYQAIDD